MLGRVGRSARSAAPFAGRVFLSMVGPTALPRRCLETRNGVGIVFTLEPAGRCCVAFLAQRCAKSNRIAGIGHAVLVSDLRLFRAHRYAPR